MRSPPAVQELPQAPRSQSAEAPETRRRDGAAARRTWRTLCLDGIGRVCQGSLKGVEPSCLRWRRELDVRNLPKARRRGRSGKGGDFRA